MFKSSYTFNDPSLLKEAVTHKSWYNEHAREGVVHSPAKGYDRLEFLGDAVLKSIQARYLFELYPQWGEGQLTQARAHMENNQQLALWCCHLGLDTIIRTGLSIQVGSKAWSNICSQVFEAYVGAIWQDCLYDFNCIYELYSSWDLPLQDQAIISHKNLLQEYIQRLAVTAGINTGNNIQQKKMIFYETLTQVGPSHEPFFSVRCTVYLHNPETVTDQRIASRGDADGVDKRLCQHLLQQHTVGQGSTRKKAETEAARQMLALLKTHDHNHA